MYRAPFSNGTDTLLPKHAPLLRRSYSERAMNRSCTHSISTRSLRPGSSVERSYDTMLRVARRYCYDTLSRLGSEPTYISCHRSRLCVLPRHYRLGPSNRLRGVFKYTLDRYLVPLRGRRFVLYSRGSSIYHSNKYAGGLPLPVRLFHDSTCFLRALQFTNRTRV